MTSTSLTDLVNSHLDDWESTDSAYESRLASERTNAVYSSHIAQISAFKSAEARKSRTGRASQTNFALWLRLLVTTAKQLLTIILLSPITFFGDPLGATYTFFVYPAIFALLLLVQLVLLVARLLGAEAYAAYLSKKYNDGLGLANWGNADNLDAVSSVPLMLRARKVFSSGSQKRPVENPHDKEVRFFDIDVAQALLCFSAIVYERDDDLVKRAADAPTEEERLRLLWESEKTIHQKAREWEMSFESVSEMKTIGGPYCGIFMPLKNEPWIVLAFKGTTPLNYSEWLLDSTFGKTNATVFLDGNVHEGFYDSIFPDGDGETSPFSTIAHTLKEAAQELGQRCDGESINLWVTGHSLGSALASLIFVRFLKSPGDLGEDITLQHAYIFGTPRIGDSLFCSRAAAYSVTPLTRDNVLWRIADNQDIIARVPPGLVDSSNFSSAVPPASLLNYGHAGAGVHLLVQKPPLYLCPSEKKVDIDTHFHIGAEVRIVAAPRDNASPPPQPTTKPTPIDRLLRLLPALIDDHVPYQYYARLERLIPDAEPHPDSTPSGFRGLI